MAPIASEENEDHVRLFVIVSIGVKGLDHEKQDQGGGVYHAIENHGLGQV